MLLIFNQCIAAIRVCMCQFWKVEENNKPKSSIKHLYGTIWMVFLFLFFETNIKIWKIQTKTMEMENEHHSNKQYYTYVEFSCCVVFVVAHTHIHRYTHLSTQNTAQNITISVCIFRCGHFFRLLHAAHWFTMSLRICWLALKIRCQMSFYRILHVWCVQV